MINEEWLQDMRRLFAADPQAGTRMAEWIDERKKCYESAMTKTEFMDCLRAMCQVNQYMISTPFVQWVWSFWMHYPDDLPGPDSVEVSQTEADTLVLRWHPVGKTIAVMSFEWGWGEWRIGDQSEKGWKKAVPILRDLLQKEKEVAV